MAVSFLADPLALYGYPYYTRDMSPIETLKSMVASKSTDELFTMLDVIDAKASKDEADRAVSAAISDTIEARHGLSAKMDEIFSDLDFDGSYTDALRAAFEAVA